MKENPTDTEDYRAIAQHFLITLTQTTNYQQLEETLVSGFCWTDISGVYLHAEPVATFLQERVQFWKTRETPCFPVCHVQPLGQSFVCVFGVCNAGVQQKSFRFSIICSTDKKIHNIHLSPVCCTEDGTSAWETAEAVLDFSEKRYEIAVQVSGVTVFEYNVRTEEILFPKDFAELYNVPCVVPNGVETLIEHGVIHPASVPLYKEIYAKIKAGESYASGQIKTRDRYGALHDFELCLTTIFDRKGNPLRAIGVRKNVSQVVSLEREREFGKKLLSDKVLVLEADFNTNHVEYRSGDWSVQFAGNTYEESIKTMAQGWVCTEHRKRFLLRFSVQTVVADFQRGESLLYLQFKLLQSGGSYLWYEATAVVIQNTVGQGVCLRLYLREIDAIKRQEQRALKEQRLYESLTSNAVLIYECNLSLERIYYRNAEGFQPPVAREKEDYSEILHTVAEFTVYSEDRNDFCAMFNRDHVLALYLDGERLVTHEYRRKKADGTYGWIKCSMHLFEDPESHDIKAYIYVEDVNQEKQEELALKYNAEHDAMTGFYNKTFAQDYVEAFLKSPQGKLGRHAFFLVDIDYFKDVNDTFGHLFGDGVIQDIAKAIASVFRDSDIIGRLGGDEFCVFMKNVKSKAIITKRAQALCTQINHRYKMDGLECVVSASVGVAIYKENGSNFTALYRYADKALYTAKEKGRNRYEL